MVSSKTNKFTAYKDEITYKCAKCGTTFKSKIEFKEHNDRKHPLRKSF